MIKQSSHISKREQKSQAILDAAEQLFARKGYGNVKMDEIAKYIGISKGSIFFYFKSKENLQMALTYRAFQALIEAYYHALEKHQKATGLVSTVGLIEAYLQFGTKHPYYYELLLDYMTFIRSEVKQNMTPALQESIYFRKVKDLHNLPLTIVVEEIERGQKDGSILNKKDPNLLYLTAWAMVIGFSKLSMASQNDSFFKVPIPAMRSYLLESVQKILLDHTSL
ncbi:MAG: TetR/AcrR family transcriptional regulator [Flammeovirgaceae bacterium]